MGVKERREREKQEVRQDIIAAARDLFIEEGYEKTSMRRVAEKIEYSPTTIYLYFNDKKELLQCVCDASFAKLVQALEEISKDTRDPLRNLRAGLKAYVDFGLKNPNDYSLIFTAREEIPKSDYMKPDHSGTKAYMHLMEAVLECVRQKQFRVVDVNITTQVLWGSIHGLTSLLIAKPHFPWAPKNKLVDAMLDALMDGLKA